MRALRLTMYMDVECGSPNFHFHRLRRYIPLAESIATRRNIIEPLQQMTRLATLFIYIGTVTERLQAERTDKEVQGEESSLERLVMGATYNAAAHGKLQRRVRAWV